MSITASYYAAGENAHMPRQTFAERFEELRIEARLPQTQAALGKALGVSGTFVNKVRNKGAHPSMRTAIRWAEKMGVCIEYLLTGRGPKHPEKKKTKEPARVLVDVTNLPPRAQRAVRDLSRTLAVPPPAIQAQTRPPSQSVVLQFRRHTTRP